MNKKTKKNKYIDLQARTISEAENKIYIIIVTEIRHLTTFDLFQIKEKVL